jgi:glycosyltransferase involved in cell wall biosynthesis
MATPAYFPLSPVTLSHIFLSFMPKKGNYSIINPDEKFGVVIPVFNEGKDIKDTLLAIFKQTVKPEFIIVSEHGSTDNTLDHIMDQLSLKKYSIFETLPTHKYHSVAHYKNSAIPEIIIAVSKHKMSKSDGVNALYEEGILKRVDRIVILDSDTILAPDYIERMRENSFSLKLTDKEAIITKNNVLGATILPKPTKGAPIIEKMIANAREAEYTFGQVLVRSGQNKTAIYVTPGCASVCTSEDCLFPDRTVTEDLELTQAIQSKRTKFEVKKEKIKEFLDEFEDFIVIFKDKGKIWHRKLRDVILDGISRKVFMIYNNAHYVDNAIAWTEEPQTIKSLSVQLDRWNAGFHQVMHLDSKDFRKGSKKLAWTIYGARYEGLASSLICLGIPLLLISYLLTGFGISPKYALFYYLADFGIQSFFMMVSFLRRMRIEGSSIAKSLFDSMKLFLRCIIPWYLLRFVNSALFLKTFFRTIYEFKFKKMRRWTSTWIRPKNINA